MNSNEQTVKKNIEELESTLDEAKRDFEADSALFKSSKIYRMGRFMRLYADLMNHLDALDDNDTTSAIENLQSDQEHKLGERLAHFKHDWDGFLEQVENQVKTNI
jgi:hypothetical protein